MQEIKCPNCGTVFQVDESGFADIVRQVRDEEFNREVRERESLLEEKLTAKLAAGETEKKLAVAEAITEAEKKLAQKDAEIAEKSSQIEKMRADAKAEDAKRRLEITEAVNSIEKERDDLAAKLRAQETERKLTEASLKERYEERLRLKEEEIAYYKDFKARQSTKMIGESLEQHCENEFNKLRAIGFQDAYFEKDNDARTGSKGD